MPAPDTSGSGRGFPLHGNWRHLSCVKRCRSGITCVPDPGLQVTASTSHGSCAPAQACRRCLSSDNGDSWLMVRTSVNIDDEACMIFGLCSRGQRRFQQGRWSANLPGCLRDRRDRRARAMSSRTQSRSCGSRPASRTKNSRMTARPLLPGRLGRRAAGLGHRNCLQGDLPKSGKCPLEGQAGRSSDICRVMKLERRGTANRYLPYLFLYTSPA